MAKSNIISASPSLSFLNQMLSLFASKQIFIPNDFVSQVSAVETITKADSSGLVNSILDFSISSGDVDFSVETSNKNLSKTLNSWLSNINAGLRGKVPTGVGALAKEYYRERWKGSSFLLLRSIWETVDGFVLPTKLWFVNGRDIKIEDDCESATIGSERYSLKISNNKTIKLPSRKNEMIFVQRPFERWVACYPTPYLIQRGVYYNAKFLELLMDKGANIVGKALEYLLMLKKGDPDLVKLGNPDFIYSKDDLDKVKSDFSKLMSDMQSNSGTPTYTTNFDTELEHLIPEYNKALTAELYDPIETRILAGLGFVDIFQGTAGTRNEAVINPKAFISEVKSGVSGFSQILHDILMTIIEKNRSIHRKFVNAELIEIRTSPLKTFFSEDTKDFLRSLYDRGLLSKRTVVELGADIDFDAEVERRKKEQSDGTDEKEYPSTMYPPVTQNQETIGEESPSPDDKILNDRKPGSPEAKNFTNAKYHGKIKKKKPVSKGETVVDETYRFMTDEAGGHTHEALIHVQRNGNTGEVTNVTGDTVVMDDHLHNISKLDVTEKKDGHVHTFKIDLLNMSKMEKENSVLKK